MRAFIVLSLVAVACADKLGYNYQPVGHSDGGLSFAPGSGGAGGVGGFGGSADLGGSRGGLGGSGGGFGGLGGSGGQGGFGGLGGSGGQGGNGGFAAGPSSGFDNASPSYSAPADFNKEFFTYSADENEFNDPNANEQVANSLKQGLRVIFIKGPENKGLENAALALAKHASEDKTAIYVLNKQADIGDLANKLNSIRNQNSNKPEVHFVKYRTPEDAANAQNQIQGQYDSLGGTSQSHNGGVAPVLNFASQGPVRSPTAHAPGNAYLPTSIFRRRI